MLLAHQYTRYMGDLSGGQVIKRILMKALNLSDDGGLKFYEFEHVRNKKAFKDKYRSSLDALQLDKDTADRLVEESIKSFELNIELFDELGVLCGYIPEDLDTVNEMSSKPSKKEAPEVKPSTEKCPFAIGQITTTQRKSAVATTGTSTPEVGTRAGVHRGKSSGENLVIILGVSVAMFAMLYAYLLA